MTINMDIAIGHLAEPVKNLAQCDIVARQNFMQLCGAREFDAACAGLLAYLRRTETTRRRIQGDGPTWDAALEAFEACLVRHVLAGVELRKSNLYVGGVNVTGAVADLPSGTRAKDTPMAVLLRAAGASVERPTTGPHGSRAPESCAPDGPQRPRLRLVEPPPCGHLGDFTHMHCAAPADHPEGLHYYVASNGSHVNDKHGGAS